VTQAEEPVFPYLLHLRHNTADAPEQAGHVMNAAPLHTSQRFVMDGAVSG